MNLRNAVIERARIEGDLIMVDGFLNHRVDTTIMRTVGRDLADVLGPTGPTVILTAEASGIPPALAVATELGLPMVFAKKYVGEGHRDTYFREVTSPTKGMEYRVEVATRVLEPGSRVAIVDDFLSRGRTAEALGEIALDAGCELTGFGFVIEKAYEDGRLRLERHGWPVASLIIVKAIEHGAAILA